MLSYRQNPSWFQPGNKAGKGQPPRAKRDQSRLGTCPVCAATFFKSVKIAKTCSRDCAAIFKKR